MEHLQIKAALVLHHAICIFSSGTGQLLEHKRIAEPSARSAPHGIGDRQEECIHRTVGLGCPWHVMTGARLDTKSVRNRVHWPVAGRPTHQATSETRGKLTSGRKCARQPDVLLELALDKVVCACIMSWQDA